MSKSTDTHNVQLTNLEILVLKYILEDLDVGLELICIASLSVLCIFGVIVFGN